MKPFSFEEKAQEAPLDTFLCTYWSCTFTRSTAQPVQPAMTECSWQEETVSKPAAAA